MTHHNEKHGHWKNNEPSRTYRIWLGMKTRCLNPHGAGYDHYGGRGIKLHKRWRIFKYFLEDIGVIPRHLTLDRIDPNGNYEPGNVRLVTMKEQANNRRNNVVVTIGGETKTIAQWSDTTGIPRSTLYNRRKYGWKDEDLVLPSRDTMKVMITAHGTTQSITEWAKETGLTKSIISQRRRRGWSDEESVAGGHERTPHITRDMLTSEGRTQSVAEWAREIGISANTIYKRRDRGWSDAECLATDPLRKGSKTLTVNGTTQCIAEWARELGISPKTIYKRRNNGWSDEECLRH